MKKIILALALLLPVTAWAQSNTTSILRPSTPSQVLAVDTTARTVTARIAQTGTALFTCTAACFFNLSATPLATVATGSFIPANSPRYILVRQGERVQVILSTSTGSFVLEELTR